jgi:uracil-DNA glycosylase
MPARSAAERREELVALYHRLRDCNDCPLAATRTKLVFGAGNADAEVMFVGEAPGANEDLQGLPFVGRAGQLLNDLLVEIGLDRDEVFITNVLKCRPPGNRDPLPEEIAECEPHLMTQIRLIEPKVICTLGNFATKLLTGRPEGITRACGRPQYRDVAGLPVVLYPLFHPAAALRTPATKEKLRADIARLPELIEAQRPRQQAALAAADDQPSAADDQPSGAGTEREPAVDEPDRDPASQLGLFA